MPRGRFGALHSIAAAGALAGAVSFPTGATNAQQSENLIWCINEAKEFSFDVAISGCTMLIQSSKESKSNVAIAFNHRGLAYLNKGDNDRAIADFNEAINAQSESCRHPLQPRYRLRQERRQQSRHRAFQRGHQA
jgi:hypothetical protein